MRKTFVLAAALGLGFSPAGAQEAKEKAAIVLLNVVDKDGVYEMQFRTPYPKGTIVRLSVDRFVNYVTWTPWLETVAGTSIELVNLTIADQRIDLASESKAVDKEGRFTFKLKPPHPGIFRVNTYYDPMLQTVRQPAKAAVTRCEHALLAFQDMQAQKVIYEESAEILDFAKNFFSTLRKAINSSKLGTEVEDKMRPLMEEAGRRGRTTFHPGTYGLMENLNAYVGSVPMDPKEPDGERVLSPNKIDVKTSNLPFSVLRESVMICFLLARECVLEAGRLADVPGDVDVSERDRNLRALIVEIDKALPAVVKLDTKGQIQPLVSSTGARKVLADAIRLVNSQLDGRSMDEDGQKRWMESYNKAAGVIRDAKKSLKAAGG